METKTTRLPADLLEAAETEGRAEHRSTAKQVEHWARFGMFLEAQTSTAARRIRQVVAGEVALEELSEDERVVANAAINARISTAANSLSFAERLAARGMTAVVLDEDGRVARRNADGSTSPL